MYTSNANSLKFRTSAGLMIFWPTMSDKSRFVLKLLKIPTELFEKAPERFVYCYGEWQP